MQEKAKCEPRPIKIDPNSPEWLEGFAAGSSEHWASSPDMRMGLTYCHGWLTGKITQRPPSLKRH